MPDLPGPRAAEDALLELKRNLSTTEATLGALNKTPGLDSVMLGQIRDLERQLEAVRKAHTQKVEQLHAATRNLDPQLVADHGDVSRERATVVQRLDTLNRNVQTAERKLKRAQRNNDTETATQAQTQFNDHRNKARAEEKKLAKLQPEYELLNAQVEAAAEVDAALQKNPDDEVEALVLEARALTDRAAELSRQVSDKPLAVQGVQQVSTDVEQFERARDYHRKRSDMYLALLLVVAAGGCWVVYSLFFGQNGVGATGWLGAAVLIGGRVALLLLVGWLIKFLGELQSRHAQQAVTYQDRVAGLGAARVIIEQGLRESREGVLRAMTASYLSLDANAFRPSQPTTDDLTVRQLNKLADVAAKLRGETTGLPGQALDMATKLIDK